MWIFGPVPTPGIGVPGERGPDVGETHGAGHQRSRVDPAVGVVLDGVGEAGGRAEDADGGDVAEHEVARVDVARCSRQADEHDAPARLDERDGARRDVDAERAVDDGVVGQVGDVVERARRWRSPMLRAKSSDAALRPARWTSMPSDSAIIAASRPIAPGP